MEEKYILFASKTRTVGFEDIQGCYKTHEEAAEVGKEMRFDSFFVLDCQAMSSLEYGPYIESKIGQVQIRGKDIVIMINFVLVDDSGKVEEYKTLTFYSDTHEYLIVEGEVHKIETEEPENIEDSQVKLYKSRTSINCKTPEGYLKGIADILNNYDFAKIKASGWGE